MKHKYARALWDMSFEGTDGISKELEWKDLQVSMGCGPVWHGATRVLNHLTFIEIHDEASKINDGSIVRNKI